MADTERSKAIARVTLAPVLDRPSYNGEMVTQLLFGETVEILSRQGTWSHIRCSDDGYEGWVDEKQLMDISQDDVDDTFVCIDLVEPAFAEQKSTYLTIGAELPNFDGITADISGVKYRFSGHAVRKGEHRIGSEIIEKLSRRFLNAPEMRGGRSPFGIESAALVQLIYKCMGVNLSRSLSRQVEEGEAVHFIEHAAPGDLAFFTVQSGEVSHVGILVSNRDILHAWGHVRMDVLDHYGIFNEELQEYTHRLKIVKRCIR